MTNFQQVSTTQSEPGREQRAFTFKATQLIWLGLGLLEGLLALRIFLKLIGANAENPFAALLYRFTDLFLFPFALVLRDLGMTALWAMGGFLGIQTLGWVYAYREGILEWK